MKQLRLPQMRGRFVTLGLVSKAGACRYPQPRQASIVIPSSIANQRHAIRHLLPGKPVRFLSTSITQTRPTWLAAVMNGCDKPGQLPSFQFIDMENLDETPMGNIRETAEGCKIGMPEADDRRVEDFVAAVSRANPETELLWIEGDTPNNDEWMVLEAHFHRVRKLFVAAGFEEKWIDGRFPLNWPLELLVIAGSCFDDVTTPVILEGRVKHLVLDLTCGLGFGEPSNKRLLSSPSKATGASDADSTPEVTAERERKTNGCTIPGSPKSERKPISLSSKAKEWMTRTHDGALVTDLVRFDPEKPLSQMKTLEILENDSMETLSQMAFACPNVILGLEHLNVRSTSGLDMNPTPEDISLVILSMLERLKELKLSLGESWGSGAGAENEEITGQNEGSGDSNLLPRLYQYLPPNLEILHFRGPASLAPNLGGWVHAFQDAAFLPSLKGLSFVLDLGKDSGEDPAPIEDLRAAKAACQQVLDAAADRGIQMLEFTELWRDEHVVFADVDPRWAGLSPGNWAP